jgi:hypothetical protein
MDCSKKKQEEELEEEEQRLRYTLSASIDAIQTDAGKKRVQATRRAADRIRDCSYTFREESEKLKKSAEIEKKDLEFDVMKKVREYKANLKVQNGTTLAAIEARLSEKIFVLSRQKKETEDECEKTLMDELNTIKEMESSEISSLKQKYEEQRSEIVRKKEAMTAVPIPQESMRQSVSMGALVSSDK